MSEVDILKVAQEGARSAADRARDIRQRILRDEVSSSDPAQHDVAMLAETVMGLARVVIGITGELIQVRQALAGVGAEAKP